MRFCPPFLVIHGDGVVSFLHVEDHYLNDLLHVTQINSKSQLAPYKTGAICLRTGTRAGLSSSRWQSRELGLHIAVIVFRQ